MAAYVKNFHCFDLLVIVLLVSIIAISCAFPIFQDKSIASESSYWNNRSEVALKFW